MAASARTDDVALLCAFLAEFGAVAAGGVARVLSGSGAWCAAAGVGIIFRASQAVAPAVDEASVQSMTFFLSSL